jgi:hypothetical protein
MDSMNFEESISKEFSKFVGSFDYRDREILYSRFIRQPRATLESIGAQLNLTRERVRQLEESVKTTLDKWVSSNPTFADFSDSVIGSTQLVARSSNVFSEIPGSLDEVSIMISPTETVSVPAWQLVQSLSRTFESVDDWTFAPDRSKVIELFNSKFEEVSKYGKFVMAPDVMEIFDGWGSASPEDLLLWTQSIGYKVFLGALVAPSVRSMNDLASVALAVKGSSMSTSEIHQTVAASKSVRSLANQMAEDSSIRRVGIETWGLSEWGDEEFSSIKDAILARVGIGESIPLEDLIAELTSKFGVAESSIRAYAAAWPLKSEQSMVSRQEVKVTPNGRPFPRAKGSYITEDGYAFRTTVTFDHARGSGSMFPTSLAVALGNSIGEKMFFTSTSTSAPIRLGWNGNQANISTIKNELDAIEATVGDEVFLTFNAGSVSFQKLADREEDPFLELGRLCLIAPSKSLTRLTVARAIGLDETAVWDEILQSAKARKDTDFVNAVRRVIDRLLNPG